MTDRAPTTNPQTVPAQIAGVTIHVTCQCGAGVSHEIDCEEDDFGAWSAAMEDRYILCDTCERLIDAGLQIAVGQAE